LGGGSFRKQGGGKKQTSPEEARVHRGSYGWGGRSGGGEGTRRENKKQTQTKLRVIRKTKKLQSEEELEERKRGHDTARWLEVAQDTGGTGKNYKEGGAVKQMRDTRRKTKSPREPKARSPTKTDVKNFDKSTGQRESGTEEEGKTNARSLEQSRAEP